jgi:hypothetical protein
MNITKKWLNMNFKIGDKVYGQTDRGWGTTSSGTVKKIEDDMLVCKDYIGTIFKIRICSARKIKRRGR